MHFNKDLIIEYIDIQRLHPYPRNARTHSKKQIRQIADSIDAFGFTNPILIDEQLTILFPWSESKKSAKRSAAIIRKRT